MRWERWRPAAFEPVDTVISTWFLAAAAAIRGSDYLRVPEESTASLSLVESTVPLGIWGSAFLLGAVVLTAGLISHRHLLIWLGHTVLGITYTVLAIGLIGPLLTISVGLLVVIGASVAGAGLLIARHLLPHLTSRRWRHAGRLILLAGLIGSTFMAPGMRTGVQTAYIAAGHFLLWLRTGSSPVDSRESHTVATVEGER